VSSTLSDGGSLTVTGTFANGHVDGTWHYAFASGLSCTPTLSGDRAGKKTVDPVDELINEFGLEQVFEEYKHVCDGDADCPTIERTAEVTAAAFTQLYCPSVDCDQKDLSIYQRTLPDLVFRAQLLAGDPRRFPSVSGILPVLLRMAFHGATDKDPASARQAASAAWRLFATMAKVDYVTVEP
jgi:hypothetical protein